MKPYFEEAGITIYHGDCRALLPIPADSLLTDPPYGVGLGTVLNGQAREKNQQPYTMFEDTPAYVAEVVVPAFRLALTRSIRAIVTPGNRNAWLYPSPDDVGVWYNPAGTGRGKWGFILAHLVLYYGKDPLAGNRATASSAWNLQGSVADLKQSQHPCPKPEPFARWLVSKGSQEGETVLDPFCGIGTTLLAAKDLGRKAIGIEIEERYCEIAANRLRQSVMQFGASK